MSDLLQSNNACKVMPHQNSVGQLQELCMKQKFPVPVYVDRQQTGPPHKPQFVIEVTAFSKSSIGVGSTKSDAKKDAAANLLEMIRIQPKIVPFQSTSSLLTFPVMSPEPIPKAIGFPKYENSVGCLQEYFQKKGKPIPVYDEISSTSEDFVMRVKVDGKETTGSGKTKKDAKSEAATKMCNMLGITEKRVSGFRSPNDYIASSPIALSSSGSGNFSPTPLMVTPSPTFETSFNSPNKTPEKSPDNFSGLLPSSSPGLTTPVTKDSLGFGNKSPALGNDQKKFDFFRKLRDQNLDTLMKDISFGKTSINFFEKLCSIVTKSLGGNVLCQVARDIEMFECIIEITYCQASVMIDYGTSDIDWESAKETAAKKILLSLATISVQ